MAVAFRKAGGSVQYVKGGLRGEHLSQAHRDYMQGIEDFNKGLPLPSNPSPSYKSGYIKGERESLHYQQSMELNRIRKELGLSCLEFQLMREGKL